jgi:hypothetical protein
MYFNKMSRPDVSNVVTIFYCDLPGKDPIKVTSEEIFQSLFHNGELIYDVHNGYPSTGPVNYSNPLDFPFKIINYHNNQFLCA